MKATSAYIYIYIYIYEAHPASTRKSSERQRKHKKVLSDHHIHYLDKKKANLFIFSISLLLHSSALVLTRSSMSIFSSPVSKNIETVYGDATKEICRRRKGNT